MFILNTKLNKSKNLILAVRPLYSFGLYRWRLLQTLLWYNGLYISENFKSSTLTILKYYLVDILGNIEMESEFNLTKIQFKKEIHSYQGLRLHLSLPVNGQWSRTNASTQRMLAWIPRKRHFLQRKNRRKFAPKEQKKNWQKIKNSKNEKK